ncbi:MAG: hypothetical protein PVJ76_00080 [Gemmatimonadota bacterium]|jgi:hypothetical protein
MTVRKALGLVALAVPFLAIFPGSIVAQDAQALMRRAMEAQAERLAGVENVTIVQETMGMEMSMYMEKQEIGGTPVLMPVSVTAAGMTQTMPQDMVQPDWSNPFQEAWIERTQLVGRDELEGNEVLVFRIDDFTGLELPRMPGSEQGAEDFRPSSFQYSMSEDDLLLRKVEMDGEMRGQDGSYSPIQMTMFMEDYREVDGYVHPFVTRVITSGMMEAADVDQEELRQQLEQMRAQMESIPESMRGMIQGQIEQMESMLGGGGEGMEVTIAVKELRVNAGGV